MKLTNDSNYIDHDFDIVSYIDELKEKYKTVYWLHIDNDIYIYKPLGRKDYKDICEDESLDKMDKEDEVLRRCLLYPNPKEFDVDDLVAGVSNKLIETIMKNSFMDNLEDRMAITNYYRQEMFDMQNQITCIINEAFPQFDIEEIENWGIERTAKYLSRAEWKLQNLRGMEIDQEYIQRQQQEILSQTQEVEPQQQEGKSDSDKLSLSNEEKTQSKKTSLTPEKLAELKRKFPEIKWEEDTLLTEGEEGMKESVDVVSPALRVGF